MNVKPFFDAAREVAGGSLSSAQVNYLNGVVDNLSPDVKTISNIGLNLIKLFEGLELRAYDDGIGVWTIGYGTIKYPNGVRVKKGDTCTEAQATEYMRNDLKTFISDVNRLVTKKINQNQFDALVSFIYNLGTTNFASSTLLKKLNSGDFTGAALEFRRWNKAGGKVMNGLTRRREAEANLFNTK